MFFVLSWKLCFPSREQELVLISLFLWVLRSVLFQVLLEPRLYLVHSNLELSPKDALKWSLIAAQKCSKKLLLDINTQTHAVLLIYWKIYEQPYKKSFIVGNKTYHIALFGFGAFLLRFSEILSVGVFFFN